MLSPTLEQVKNLLTIYPTVPVFYEVLADHVTPIQVFMALRKPVPRPLCWKVWKTEISGEGIHLSV